MREMFTDPEQKKGAATLLALQIIAVLMKNDIPACDETNIALRLIPRLYEIVPDNPLELFSDEAKFVTLAKQELDFIIKDR